MSEPEVLWHFTCAHDRRDIGTSNCLLLPNAHPWLGAKLVWLTDQADPDRALTGLTMKLQACDRMAYRYMVTDLTYCRRWAGSLERARLDPARLADFERLEDGRLASFEHWWISDRPVRARLDRSWAPPRLDASSVF